MSTSTSQKNPKRQSGKDRSQRIQIDYYQIRSNLDRWRNLCALLGLLIAGGYAVYVLAILPGRGGGKHLSTGPISAAHASFEDNCQTCHLDFTPLDPHAPTQWLPIIGGDADASREQMEQACQQCHDIGAHHRSHMHASFAVVDQTCAHCHHEHEGREQDLTSITHQTCAQCHQDLSEVVNGKPQYRASVVGFDQDTHGDFTSLEAQDPGKILFSHHQHMLPGQVGPDQKGGMTLAQLSPAERKRYRLDGQVDTDTVQLQCSSCHTLPGQELLADSEQTFAIDVTRLGSTMKPIEFDRHCSACHAISGASASGEVLPLPHAAPWSQIKPLLAASINGDRATGVSTHRRDTSRAQPQLGTGVSPAGAEDWRVSDAEVAAAMLRVKNQCLDCHEPESINDQTTDNPLANEASPMIPRRWLRSGYYDHAVHRQIACQFCHADAFPELAGEAELKLGFDDTDRVMIAGIESCQGCHRPAGTPAPATFKLDHADWINGMTTWASDQCTTCHRYHTPPAFGSHHSESNRIAVETHQAVVAHPSAEARP